MKTYLLATVKISSSVYVCAAYLGQKMQKKKKTLTTTGKFYHIHMHSFIFVQMM